MLSGRCLAIVEGEERLLGPWDYLHCPGGTEHVLVGAGDGPCVVIAYGARRPDDGTLYVADTIAAAPRRERGGRHARPGGRLRRLAAVHRRPGAAAPGLLMRLGKAGSCPHRLPGRERWIEPPARHASRPAGRAVRDLRPVLEIGWRSSASWSHASRSRSAPVAARFVAQAQAEQRDRSRVRGGGRGTSPSLPSAVAVRLEQLPRNRLRGAAVRIEHQIHPGQRRDRLGELPGMRRQRVAARPALGLARQHPRGADARPAPAGTPRATRSAPIAASSESRSSWVSVVATTTNSRRPKRRWAATTRLELLVRPGVRQPRRAPGELLALDRPVLDPRVVEQRRERLRHRRLPAPGRAGDHDRRRQVTSCSETSQSRLRASSS